MYYVYQNCTLRYCWCKFTWTSEGRRFGYGGCCCCQIFPIPVPDPPSSLPSHHPILPTPCSALVFTGIGRHPESQVYGVGYSLLVAVVSPCALMCCFWWQPESTKCCQNTPVRLWPSWKISLKIRVLCDFSCCKLLTDTPMAITKHFFKPEKSLSSLTCSLLINEYNL